MTRYCVIHQEVADDVVVKTDPLHASEFDDRPSADIAAREAAESHQSSGYDDAGAFWWGRNTGGITNRYMAVSTDEARRMRGT